MTKRICCLLAMACSMVLAFSGCPWSSSPNVFKEAKGISMPNFGGGPPPQSEPPLDDQDFN